MPGNTVKSIGAGLFVWPHGFDLNAEGNLWITEGAHAAIYAADVAPRQLQKYIRD